MHIKKIFLISLFYLFLIYIYFIAHSIYLFLILLINFQ